MKIYDGFCINLIPLCARIPKLILFLQISNFRLSSGRYEDLGIFCRFMNCFPHEDIRHGDIGTESASTSIRMNSSSLGSPPIMFVLRLHAKTKTTPIQNFMYQNKPRRLRGRGNRSDSLLSDRQTHISDSRVAFVSEKLLLTI